MSLVAAGHVCLYLPQIWGAWGVHVPLLANLKLEQLASRGGLWSGMGYQLGGGAHAGTTRVSRKCGDHEG